MAYNQRAAQVWKGVDVALSSSGVYIAVCGICDWTARPFSTEAGADAAARLHVAEEHE